MRRARPYRGENPGPGKDVHGELDHRPGIREQPRSLGDIGVRRYDAMAMTGTVKFYNGERGYGFIKPHDGGREHVQ
jgi:hypothetical protein